MFARFTITNYSGVGNVEVATDESVQVFEQGKLWEGVPRRPPCLCVGEHVCDGNAKAVTAERPALRLIQGGKA